MAAPDAEINLSEVIDHPDESKSMNQQETRKISDVDVDNRPMTIALAQLYVKASIKTKIDEIKNTVVLEKDDKFYNSKISKYFQDEYPIISAKCCSFSLLFWIILFLACISVASIFWLLSQQIIQDQQISSLESEQEESKSDLMQLITELKGNITTLNQELTATRTELTNSISSLQSSIETSFDLVKGNITTLNQELSDTKSELANSISSLQISTETSFDLVKGNITTLNQELTATRTELTNSISSLQSSIETSFDLVKGNITTLNQELSDTKSELANSISSLQISTETSFDLVKGNITTLNQDLSDARSELANSINQVSQNVSELHNSTQTQINTLINDLTESGCLENCPWTKCSLNSNDRRWQNSSVPVPVSGPLADKWLKLVEVPDTCHYWMIGCVTNDSCAATYCSCTLYYFNGIILKGTQISEENLHNADIILRTSSSRENQILVAFVDNDNTNTKIFLSNDNGLTFTIEDEPSICAFFTGTYNNIHILCGGHAYIKYFNGSVWTNFNMGTNYYAINVFSQNEGYGVTCWGWADWDGVTWTHHAQGWDFCDVATVSGVRICGNLSLFAAGNNNFANTLAIWKFEEGAQSFGSKYGYFYNEGGGGTGCNGEYAVVFGENDVFVSGIAGTCNPLVDRTILHYDGASWSHIETANMTSSSGLWSPIFQWSSSSEDGIYIIGKESNVIYRYC